MMMSEKTSLKSRLMQCAAASFFGAVLVAATPAAAQQTVVGVSPNCPIVDGEAVCEGDLEDGITAAPGGTPFDTLTIQNATTPIAPPGYFGIGVVRNTDTTINIADDIVIDTYDDPNIGGAAQGLIAIVGQGGDLVIDTGADITTNGNGAIAVGIEAVTRDGDGNLDIVNRGDIEAFSSFQSAMAIQARQINSTGRITVENSGNLTATSGGTGERDFVTAGILANHENGGGDIDITNSGAISVSATTTDTDFNGVAAGIVTNSFVGANTTNITNSGAIDATGNAVHGIVGFTFTDSMSDAATLNVVNEATGTLAIDGSVNYGMLVQTAGTHVNSTASNAAAITMANGDASTGIMMLNRAQTASIDLSNEGDISGEGSSLRGLGVFTFQAPVGGDYDILIENSGDITFDTPLGRGISIAVTEEDTATATVVNSGNIDMANTTDANSHGIGLNFEIIDPNAAGAMADSSVELTNSGDITMGSGAGIWLVADSITAENTGDIVMADGMGMLITDFSELALTHSGSIVTTGANSDGIVVDASNSPDWEVLVTETGAVTTTGPGSVGIRVTGVTDDYLEALIHETTAAVTVEKAKLADRAMNAVTQYISSAAPGNGGVSSASSASKTQAGSVAPASHGGSADVGSVIVNGTVTSNGGAGAILGEGALRVSSDNAGAVISTTGDNAPVISVQSSLYLYSGEGLTLSSTGANAPLFQVLGGGDNTAFVALDHVNASTTGDGSTAFWLDGQGGDSVALFDVGGLDPASPSIISTMGDNADAVRFVTTGSSTFVGLVDDTEITTAGDGSMGLNIVPGMNSSANLALADTSVTTGGANSDAVHIGVGETSDVLLLVERSTIATTGSGSDAIDIPQVANSSIGNAVILDSSISTTGDNARALVFGELGGTTSTRNTFIAGSDLTTQGEGATAVLLGAFGNSSLSTTNIDGVTIATAGANARGVDHGLAGDSSAMELTITDTTISTTGSVNAGALVMEGAVNTSSAATVNLSDITFSTEGTDSDAIFVGGGGFDSSVFLFDITDATLATQGDNSRGLVIDQFIASQDSTSVATMDGVTISTMGAGSDGIVLGTSGDGSMVNSSTDFSASGLDITTAGDNARGIYLAGLTGDMVEALMRFQLSDSTITTSGENAIGMELFGIAGDGGSLPDAFSGGAFLLERLGVETSGNGASGLVFGAFGDNSVRTVDLFNSSISTAGSDAWGVFIPGVGQSSAMAVTGDQVTITTEGDNSGALYLGGIGAGSSESFDFSNMELTTAGANADALFMEGMTGESSVMTIDMLNLTIVTSGENSRGMIVENLLPDASGTVAFSADNLSISTTGANAHGYRLGASSTGSMLSSSVRIDSTGLDITTGGDGARGLYIEGLAGDFVGDPALRGGNSDLNLILSDMTISTAGDNAVALEALGVGGVFANSGINFVADGIDITTTGAGSHGFVVGALPEAGPSDDNKTQLAVNFGTIDVSGEGADAIRIGAGWGVPGAQAAFTAGDPTRFAVMEIAESVSASGAGGNGLVTDSLINRFQVSASGTLSADGFAILSQGAGGIEDLTNDGTITGDIRLGDEDSDLTNAGTITGNIDMGGGVNSIMIEETGVLNSLDQILIGDGNAITVAGMIAPGGDGPMQTTMIGSDLVLEAGSSYLVDISGTAADPSLAGIGMSDRLEVDGTVTINGGDVVVSSLTPEGDFTDLADYRILGGADGIAGAFDMIDADLPFLNLSLVYNPDSVLLRAERLGFGSDAVPFASIARTPNQQAVAEAFDVIEDDATGDMDVVIDNLVFSSEAQALTAYDQTSGDVYAALLSQTSHSAIASAQRLVARAHARSAEGWGIWAGASGRDGSIDGDGNAAGLDHDETGLDFGVDYAGAGNAWAVGASAGLIEGSATVSDRMSSADYDGWRAGLYARHGNGNTGLGLTAAVDYSETDADVSRDITVNALSRMAAGTVGAETLAVSAEARYGFAAAGGWALGPVASVTSALSDFDGISESGADSLNLVGGLASHDATRFGAGMFANWQGARGTVDIAAQYVGGDSDTASFETSFAGAPGTAFTVIGPEVESTGAMISAAGSYALGGGWTLGGEVSALTGTDQESVSGGLTLGWTFP